MTFGEIQIACRRVAAIMGGKAVVAFWCSNDSGPSVMVRPKGYDAGAPVQSFGGFDVFDRAEAYARAVVAERDAAVTEYDSWFAEPQLPLAAE